MSTKRWEDVTPIWKGPDYSDCALRYAPCVERGYLAGGLITCVDVVDWSGEGTRDLILSSWDACYGGRAVLRREVDQYKNGTPRFSRSEPVEGITGYVTSVPDGELFHLISASRLRRSLYFYENVGVRGAPCFAPPKELHLKIDWVKSEREIIHLARFADIDGDGELELVVGTDYWDDYWPNGIEWNEEGYRAYDAAGRWLGGPLRGFLYVFKNEGTGRAPRLARGMPVSADDHPLEVYGQLAPAFGDFTEAGRQDLVCGEFRDVLHIASNAADGTVESPSLVTDEKGDTLKLDHCIHFPCAVDWNGNGKLDLLVGAEDGYVSWLENAGGNQGRPMFKAPKRVETEHSVLHAGVLPVPAAHDWNGNGLPDLAVGNSGGELLFYKNVGAPGAPVFDRETALTVEGKPIRIAAGPTGSIQGPSESRFGYTCPTIADWDHDGHPDILMSDIFGRHVFFQNDGGAYPPTFKREQLLTHDGLPLATVWRVRPAVVNWGDDGLLSYVTLDESGILSSYDQATLTDLTDKRTLTWEDGEPIRFTEDVGGGLGRIKLCVCDWTGDGRYDLIIGTHGRASVPPGPNGYPRHTTGQAGVLLLKNVGSNSEPVFSRPRPFKYDDQAIEAGMHACAPEAILLGNGLPDLLMGIEDGSIVLLPRKRLAW